VWALSTTETALTAHLVTTGELIDNAFLREVQQQLHDNFDIEHATLQIENETSENNCRLKLRECI
jgi:cobalt-zinc-cadmium efflux system protein